MRRSVVVLGLVAVSQAGLAVGVPAAAAGSLSCGDTITTDTTLHADLLGCRDNGIVIGADHVRLNLNGHTIDGDGALVDPCDAEICDVGVGNPGGYDDVAVVGGTIQGFGFGVLIGGSHGDRVSRLDVVDNKFAGILVFDAGRLRIDRNQVSRNGLDTDFSGLALFATHHSRIDRNLIASNGDIGIYTEDRMNRNVIAGNVFLDNPEAGMILDGAGNLVAGNRFRGGHDTIILTGDRNVVRHNLIRGMPDCSDHCGYGISFEGGVGNLIERNVVRNADFGIRVDAFTGLAARTVIRANLVAGASVDGIVVDQEHAGTVEDTLVARNLVVRSGDDGIDVANASTTIARNLAVHSGDRGIEAVAGVTDGGGNRAVGSGNPQECSGVAC